MIRRNVAMLVFMFLSINYLFAWQEPHKPAKKKKGIAANVDSIAIKNPVKDDSATMDIHYFLFPEFYHYWPIDVNDTIFKYQCYDAQNNLVSVDTLHNINDVRHIYFVKSYANYMRTYIDDEGKPRPSSVNKTLYSYDKTDIDAWNSRDYINHYNAQLKENKNEIVRIDTTVVTDSVTASRQLTIRKYYRVTEIKPDNQILNH